MKNENGTNIAAAVRQLYDRCVYGERAQVRREALRGMAFVLFDEGHWLMDGEKYANDHTIRMVVNQLYKPYWRIISDHQNASIGTVFSAAVDDKRCARAAGELTALKRADEYDSGLKTALLAAFKEGVACGFGAVELYTDYAGDDPLVTEQRIRFAPVHEAVTHLFFDPDDFSEDKAASKYAIRLRLLLRSEAEEMWGEKGKRLTSFDATGSMLLCSTPEDMDTVVVAEYYKMETVKQQYIILENSAVMVYGADGARPERKAFEPDQTQAIQDLLSQGWTEIGRRKIDKTVCVRYIVDGSEVIEGRTELPFKRVPYIPVYGRRPVVLRGVERFQPYGHENYDANRALDAAFSQILTSTMKPSHHIPIMGVGAVSERCRASWQAMANGEDVAYVEVEKDPATQQAIAPAGFIPPAELPVSSVQMMNSCWQYTRESTGQISEGEKIVANVSGEAKLQAQKEIDKASAGYHANLENAVVAMAKLWLDGAKEVYYEPGRRMTGRDAKNRPVTVEVPEITVSGRNWKDITFDVTADIVLNASSRKDFMVNSLMGAIQYVQGSPDTQVIMAMAIVRELDNPDLAKWARKELLARGVGEPDEEEAAAMQQAAQAQQPDPQAVLALAAAKKEEAHARKLDEEAGLTTAKTEKTAADTMKTLAEVMAMGDNSGNIPARQDRSGYGN